MDQHSKIKRKIHSNQFNILENEAIKQGIEPWKPIGEYPNYSVSSKGQVKNVTTNKLLQPCYHNQGYQISSLCNNLKPSSIKIHRLVATAFIDNPYKRLCVDHINNNKTDNNVENFC